MPTNKKNDTKSKLRIIVLTVVGIVAFVVSVFMNIVGMTNAINKAPDSSGMAGISVRTSGKGNLGEQKTTKVNENTGKVVEEEFSVNALPIINLINNNWDRVQARFSGFELDSEGNASFEEDGYKLYCNGKYVNYIVFNNNFQKEIVGHLKINADKKTIEATLGTPTFERSECIGYKSREIYAFFYDGEIIIYPNRKMNNKNLETLLYSYKNGTYVKGRTYFLVDIRNNYPDFVIEQDVESDVITITSTTRQVIAKLDGLGNIEVEFYNGYEISEEMTKNKKKKKIYLTSEEDLVEIFENERVNGK